MPRAILEWLSCGRGANMGAGHRDIAKMIHRSSQWTGSKGFVRDVGTTTPANPKPLCRIVQTALQQSLAQNPWQVSDE
jgi:hypothetical protein